MTTVKVLDISRQGSDIVLKLQVNVDFPELSKKEYQFARNVLDFERLFNYLRICFPATFIPSPPAFEAVELPIIKYAARKFLQRILLNETLRKSEGLVNFIESEFLILHLPQNIPGRSPKSTRNKIMSLWPVEVKEIDEFLERSRIKTGATLEWFQSLIKATDVLSAVERENSASFQDCALRFQECKLDAFKSANAAFLKAHELYHLHSKYLVLIFGELMLQQIKSSQTMQNCFDHRIQQLKTYDYACKRTIRKVNAINSLKSTATIKQEKVDLAIEELENAKKLEEEAKTCLSESALLLKDQVATFVKQRDQDLLEMIHSYSKKQLLLQENLLTALSISDTAL